MFCSAVFLRFCCSHQLNAALWLDRENEKRKEKQCFNEWNYEIRVELHVTTHEMILAMHAKAFLIHTYFYTYIFQYITVTTNNNNNALPGREISQLELLQKCHYRDVSRNVFHALTRLVSAETKVYSVQENQ